MGKMLVRILVVDDESEIRRFLHAALKMNEYEVIEAVNGEEALKAVINQHPDLMIIDLGLPDISGSEVTRQVREWSRLPIIILSVRDREVDKINALDAGADDYLTKPFGVGELLARIRVVLRHLAPSNQEPVYRVGALVLDLARHQLTLDGRDISLTPTEYDLLKALIENPGKVITHRHLTRMVWGSGYDEDGRLLRVNISNLRRKIEPNPNQPYYIQTELGVGYRFREE